MKKTLIIGLLVILGTVGLMGQNSGKGFNFQAVARNSDGSIQSEQAVQLTISIYPTVDKQSVLYSENNTATTDKFGVFSLVIGNGVYQAGSASTFGEIDFGAADLDPYLNVVLIDGASNPEIVHAPLLSVPYAESSFQADNGMPIGAIIPYAGEVTDNSDNITVYGCKGIWRLCNGTEYDPAEFISLHMVLGDAWGTNLLPDLRGTFLRGTNYSANDDFSDPDASSRVSRDGAIIGDHVGSFQADEIESHTHDADANYLIGAPGTGRIIDGGWGRWSDSKTLSPTGGNETRPKNANVNFIIRVK